MLRRAIPPKADTVHEFELIDRIIECLGDSSTGRGVVLGPGDDAAVLEVPEGHQLVVSTDTLVVDRHYPAGACADAIGYRSLAVAVSDLAAMGATPAYATVSLTTEALTANWAEQYANGLATAAASFGIAIVGGNLARGPQSITITVHGYTPRGAAITRAGAAPGDHVYVTGALGGAGLALADENLGDWSLVSLAKDTPLKRYWMPQPRLGLGVGLRGIATAAIDISDGLTSDLDHLCRASGIRCEVHLDHVPVYVGAAPLEAVAMGDDYELAFTAPPQAASEIEALAAREDVAVTCIAIAEEGPPAGVAWYQDGVPIDIRPGYRHF